MYNLYNNLIIYYYLFFSLRNVLYNCVKVDLTKQRLVLYSANDENNVGSYGSVVDTEHCSFLPKPPSTEPCQGTCDATRWEYSDWTDCTKTCGSGIQKRTARCVDENNESLADGDCNEKEKIVEQICNTLKCPSWSFGDWTPVSHFFRAVVNF